MEILLQEEPGRFFQVMVGLPRGKIMFVDFLSLGYIAGTEIAKLFGKIQHLKKE